ncbi:MULTISPECIES: hypothetical protein [Francisella]|uniref:Uncharacterized protein n=1 Tax=Francisella opportunistica TaxID=2016517 RepID=A0A345JSK7_9GAMM|nr:MULTISPECIES: hypothetical protein [Francisella]APC92073.1 hypothetical protein BBG19_1345 [Francisella sp. MA067296]AXH30303.1 hypothetical protein CGC43_06785 [Francisella opportunistica]AXH31944.1 hypothetical protein CGC44_06765 [Francisella opportunistica]AXH33590.1 hypothetical protein CGC45_06780 [Francisella opportunistica]
MKKKVLSSLLILSLCWSVSIADTITAKAQQAVNIDSKDNPLRQYAAKTSINSDSALLTQNQIASGSVIKQNEAPKANDYGDALSSLVDTSDDDYEKLLAEAEEILKDNAPSETKKKIDAFNLELATKAKQEKQKLKKSATTVLTETHNVIKGNHNIDQVFKKSQNYYKAKSAEDYIDENVKKYNDQYKIKNYKSLLNNISTPEQIDKSFDEIDKDGDEDKDKDNLGFNYKLSDGYTIEQITTVGLLSGEQQRFKKCLIMKTYGGGTWRTYCQPLKKPTQCSIYDWQQLTTMPVMYC